MPGLENVALLVDKIASNSGKSPAEVQALIEKKKKHFSGLLTDSGAALMVAKELGISIELEKSSLETVKISQLQEGMQNLDLLVRVVQVFSPRTFERNGRHGRLCSLIVADSTGEIRLTAWHKDVEKLEELAIERGSVLLLRNCYVTAFNERLQLNLSYSSEMIRKGEVEAKKADLPDVESTAVKLSALHSDMNDVNVVARVLQTFAPRHFERDGRQGTVMNFLIADETATVRAAAWNDLAENVRMLQQNDVVKIEGAYTREGMQGVELNLGWRARILRNPASGAKLPDAIQLSRKSPAAEKRIAELGAAQTQETFAVRAKIIDILPGQLRYSVCPQCGKKAQRLENGFVCDACGEIEKPDINAVISIKIDDGSANITAVLFGAQAEAVTKLRKAELQRAIAEKGVDVLIAELRGRLVGKGISLQGRTRTNAFSNELEFIANYAALE